MLNSNQKTFLIIWFGQFVSLVGTGITRFAVLIWAYQQTGAATTLAILGFFFFVPYAVISPFAGVVVDRFDRRKVMLVTDGTMGAVTITLLILFTRGELAIWHLFAAELLFGVFDAFQTPAYAAAMTVLVPKNQLSRMNGLVALGQNASRVLAPFIGGALLPLIDLDGVMWIDVVTFVIAMLTLLIVRVPLPPTSDEAEVSVGGWRQSLASVSFGLRYIWRRPGLRGLMLLFAAANVLAGITYFGVLPAMVLARTDSNELALATVQAVLGIGGVVGAALMTMWGGSRHKIDTVLIPMALSFLLGDMLLGIGRNPLVWAVGAFAAQILIPPLFSAMLAIFQSKTPLDQQGRVLAARDSFVTLPLALGFLIGGPLADFVFEPAMAVGGVWEPAFGWLVGSGPGAGMGLMFVCTATIGCTLALLCYLSPSMRNVETDLPDYDVPLSVAAEN